jgi:uncharacterized membrane protein
MSTFFWVHLFHILIVGGLFLYVGFMRNNIPRFMYPVLIVLGIVIILYHAYKIYKSPKTAWINYIHIFLVAPLLILIGYNGEKTSRKYYELLLMLAFSAIGYHGYYLIQETI